MLPTPVFWPGEFHGLNSPWGRKESDMTEQVSLSLPYHKINPVNMCSPVTFSILTRLFNQGLPCGSEGKESAFSVGDLGLIPGLGRLLEEGMVTHSSILAWRVQWTV